MSEAAITATEPVAPAPESKRRRTVKIVSWIVGLVLLLVLLNLVGIDVRGWLERALGHGDEISFGYIIVGCLFQGLQTVLDRARLVRDPALRISAAA